MSLTVINTVPTSPGRAGLPAMIFSRVPILRGRLLREEGSRCCIWKSFLFSVSHRNDQEFHVRGETTSEKPAEKQPEPFHGREARGRLCWGRDRQRQISGKAPSPDFCSCLPVCTDTSRRKALEERCEFPVAAGRWVEALALVAHSFSREGVASLPLEGL